MSYMQEPQRMKYYRDEYTLEGSVTFSELEAAFQAFRSSLLSKFPVELDDDSIKISATRTAYGDDAEIVLELEFSQTSPNPTYDQEMEKYREWQAECHKERMEEKERARIEAEAHDTKLMAKKAASEARFAKKISSIMEDNSIPYGKRAAEVEALIAKKYWRRGGKFSNTYK